MLVYTLETRNVDWNNHGAIIDNTSMEQLTTFMSVNENYAMMNSTAFTLINYTIYLSIYYTIFLVIRLRIEDLQ
jgi:hypothetical protein